MLSGDSYSYNVIKCDYLYFDIPDNKTCYNSKVFLIKLAKHIILLNYLQFVEMEKLCDENETLGGSTNLKKKKRNCTIKMPSVGPRLIQ